MSESHRPIQLLKSSASSATRVLKDRAMVAQSLDDRETRRSLKQVVKPNCISKTMRKAGVALLLSPDPITDVPGAILLGASFAARGRDPLNPASLFNETRKILGEIGSFL